MTEALIVQTALDNLKIASKSEWGRAKAVTTEEMDGRLLLTIDGEEFEFFVEVKNELRESALPRIYQLKKLYEPFLLIVYRLSPEVKKQLQKNNIAYLEANGNFYLKTSDKWFWIETNKPLKAEKIKGNRAFTKTGLKVVFEFLNNSPLINCTYREIAEKTGTSIGNITHIINGLKKDNLLLPIDKHTLHIQNYHDLLIRWAEAYEIILKPLLEIGTFRFLKESDFYDWKSIILTDKRTLWGGEPAGDLLTEHLRPEKLTLYTDETRGELMKKYRLIPDINGNVCIYKKFWQNSEDKYNAVSLPVVPIVVVYADLMSQKDKRTRETALIIYEQYLQAHL